MEGRWRASSSAPTSGSGCRRGGGGGRQVGCLEVLFLRLPGVGWADGVETNADAVKGVEEEGEEGFCCLLL